MSHSKSTSKKVVEEALGDRYQIEAELGEGSFGSVYRANDKFLNRTVAVKSVRLDSAPDQDLQEDVRRRFLREARVAAQLRHPNIVTIYDIVSTPQASLIIMEFVEGVTLQSVLASKKRLDLAETLEILFQTAKALDHAHEHKVVHRDVKPANILITPAKEVRVTDFGIAKTEVSDLTLTGTILGTPDYMSPEQAKGEEVDARADLFSLGCVLYECLVGERPFQSGSITGVLLRIINERPPDVDWPGLGLPSGLAGVVEQAMAKDPSDRFSSGVALIQALGTLPHEAEEKPGVLHLKTLRDEERPLGFSGSSQEVLENLNLSKEEAFIISRIDGQARPGDLLAAAPSEERETARALLGLIEAGIIKFQDEGGLKKEAVENQTPGNENSTDEAAVREINDRYQLSLSQDHAQMSPAAEPPQPENGKRIDEGIFERAELAFLKQDYWETIQLCRYAIGHSGEDAKYHHLLGLALHQNVYWQEESKESLQRAAELDPDNPEYFAALENL